MTIRSSALRSAGIGHARVRARWTGRILRVEIEGCVDPGLSVAQADQLGVRLAKDVRDGLPEARSVTFTPRAMPAAAA
jgi:divalent metal cation (Fe/Co/Zn/Cd) transporter